MSLRRSGRNKEPLQGVESSAGPIQDVENTNEDASREIEDVENTNKDASREIEDIENNNEDTSRGIEDVENTSEDALRGIKDELVNTSEDASRGIEVVENTDPNTPTVSTLELALVSKRKTPDKRKAQPKEKADTKKRKTMKKADIHKLLEKMGGDLYSDNTGNCVRAAIQKGFIKITGRQSDLKKVIHSETGPCGHVIKATLADLLEQPDYAGTDYEDGLQDATVLCTVDGCAEDEGRTYVTDICTGKPQFDDGKGHNHCTECKAFGKCTGDYRQSHCYHCGKHYFGGFHRPFECPCQRKTEDVSSQCNQQ